MEVNSVSRWPEIDQATFNQEDIKNLIEAQKRIGSQVESRLVEAACKYGLVQPGLTLEDYLRDAALKGGYATVLIWGEQAAGKSNRLLQEGFWILGDWDLVLKHLLFKPSTWVEKLRAIPMGKRYPWLGWDDLGVHLPSSVHRTDIEMYERIDATWAAIRTKCSVVTLTIPLIDRVLKAIKDNISFEVYLGKNQVEMVERICRIPSYIEMNSTMFKVLVEGPRKFQLFDVPRDVFKEYWEMRLTLTEEALEKLSQVAPSESVQGYIGVMDLASEIRLSPNTILQLCSRGAIDSKKVNRKVYVAESDVQNLKSMYGQDSPDKIVRRFPRPRP